MGKKQAHLHGLRRQLHPARAWKLGGILLGSGDREQWLNDPTRMRGGICFVSLSPQNPVLQTAIETSSPVEMGLCCSWSGGNISQYDLDGWQPCRPNKCLRYGLVE